MIVVRQPANASEVKTLSEYLEREPPEGQAIAAAMEELKARQRVLDYSTKEFTVELLVEKFKGDDADIYVPPYQRQFNWREHRQSRFIESVLLGLPIPFLFFADMEDGRFEVVDGTQRLSTCAAFMSNDLELVGLERLSLLDGFRFADISKSQRRKFKNRTIRSIVLAERTTESDRRDLFDRINTGSLIAMPAEIRRGARIGPVTDLIDELARDERFSRLARMTSVARRKREAEELVSRFLAFTDGLDGYADRVSIFLDKWLKKANAMALNDADRVPGYRDRFHLVMGFVERTFPNGFSKTASARTTPRVRFDAIAVGAWKAESESPGLLKSLDADISWLTSDDFFLLTTSSSANSRVRIERRSDFVRDQLMSQGSETDA